jgi:hypothetical protein
MGESKWVWLSVGGPHVVSPEVSPVLCALPLLDFHAACCQCLPTGS